jgi:hypothetical protein
MAWAAELPVFVVSLTAPVRPFSAATLQIQTSPDAICTMTVLSKSGPSRAEGLIPQTADRNGWITWRWRVDSDATSGQWPIVVKCTKGSDSGELRTRLEVR